MKNIIYIIIAVSLILGGFGYYMAPDNVVAPATSRTDSSDMTAPTKEQRFGYINKIEQVGSSYSMVVDYAEFVDCSNTPDCPNGMKIVNENPMLRTIPLASDVMIRMETFSYITEGELRGNFNSGEQITVQQLQESLRSSTKYSVLPFWFTIENGRIIEVKEQFIP